MRTYLLYFFACLRLSDINVKPIKKEEHHHYSCAKVVFLFQKKTHPDIPHEMEMPGFHIYLL